MYTILYDIVCDIVHLAESISEWRGKRIVTISLQYRTTSYNIVYDIVQIRVYFCICDIALDFGTSQERHSS